MSDFDAALDAARSAQRKAYDLGIELDLAYDGRNRAIARAWRTRPDGLCWADVVRVVNEGLPRGAWLTVPAARVAERLGRKG